MRTGTGIALVPGTILLLYWLGAAAAGAEAYATAKWLIGTWIGRLCLLGWTFSLLYHLCNGIRHLVWDLGYGFELNQARASSAVVILATAALTLATWFVGYMVRGEMT